MKVKVDESGRHAVWITWLVWLVLQCRWINSCILIVEFSTWILASRFSHLKFDVVIPFRLFGLMTLNGFWLDLVVRIHLLIWRLICGCYEVYIVYAN